MADLSAAAHSVAFRATMKVHAWRGLPAMTPREREAYAKVLTTAPHAEKLRIIEWGSGYSTIWAAKLLTAAGVPFHIDTVDNHRGWHERVREMIAKAGFSESVTLHLREFPPFWEKGGWDWAKEPTCGQFAPSSDPERAYVELPWKVGGTFDVALVDARFRRRCLEVASEVVRRDGFVVLHDAQKPWYHGPTALFEHARFIDSGGYYPTDPGTWRIWVGSHENAGVEKL